jgi:hypothetical protein
MSELTGLVLMGVVGNFVTPIVLGLAPWAVLLADRSAGAPWALFAHALSIGLGSIGLVVLSNLVAKSFSGGAAMKDRAEFMIRVARLAERSKMPKVAEDCLRECLELCHPFVEVYWALEARARLIALLVSSGRREEAEMHESATHNVCAAHLTGWRGFLRRYVALGAPRSLSGLIIDAPRYFTGLISDGGFANHGAAYAKARLHAGLQRADEAVAELTRACELGLREDVIKDELFDAVRLRRPDEFAKLGARITKNSRNHRGSRVWRWPLFGMIVLGIFGSFFACVFVLARHRPTQHEPSLA